MSKDGESLRKLKPGRGGEERFDLFSSASRPSKAKLRHPPPQQPGTPPASPHHNFEVRKSKTTRLLSSLAADMAAKTASRCSGDMDSKALALFGEHFTSDFW